MLNRIFVSKPSLGVGFTDAGRAEINLWAPYASKVSLDLPERGITLPMEKGNFGYWWINTDKLKQGDLYQYVLDDDKKRPDPVSVSQPQCVNGPSRALDVCRYDWQDTAWTNPPLAEYIIYELHVGTFTPEGTFAALEEKLDYLKELGITAIEIMPVAQFPNSRNWGYDGVYPYAVQDSYGGAVALQHLVDACHDKGLAVILDVVYNHMGPEGSVFNDYGPYHTKKYCTPWGDAINFDDEWCDGVRHYFTENALMWFRDFHVDALRLDAVHHLKDFSTNHILREMKQCVDKLAAETGRQYYLIAECDLNDPVFIDPLEKRGYGMDAQWCDEFHHALRVAIGEPRNGYYVDFNGVNDLAKAFQDGYVYDGQFSKHRKKMFGAKAETNPGQQLIVFSQNHDQIGNRMLGERSNELYSNETAKLMAGAVLVSPFLPMLFMGEEWGETNPFLYFVSHNDPELVEQTRQGREGEFADFQQEGDVPDPLADDTFQRSKLQWQLLDKEEHQAFFQYYRTLIALRKEHPALRNLNRWQMIITQNVAQSLLVMHRWEGDEHLLCLMNFSHDTQSATLPARNRRWRRQLDSADTAWCGPGTSTPEYATGTATFLLQPQSMVLYTSML
ncbi:malto-oligosyltrehalose trehalohydrolase [Spirosoma sp. KUDC1026]|uniref:malto-oligosyltrehalose trehalohydrolase n=1 Tax=Spirosoma sp. KUDC1026 TaxID=2745947 RepID=UPI00159BD802|nr:malto-oligosyltrehalose trehalohydrolase [Spirosoma sp. KUDC1026]QKZ13019.1 malto-oligosyltrehalose trehalohydrolase [Spirosoma sp. KUDC1026]